jgi:hypothetical protein
MIRVRVILRCNLFFQINTYAFVKLKDAMSQPHGTAVDVAAVVAWFGPADNNYMPPHVADNN